MYWEIVITSMLSTILWSFAILTSITLYIIYYFENISNNLITIIHLSNRVHSDRGLSICLTVLEWKKKLSDSDNFYIEILFQSMRYLFEFYKGIIRLKLLLTSVYQTTETEELKKECTVRKFWKTYFNDDVRRLDFVFVNLTFCIF